MNEKEGSAKYYEVEGAVFRSLPGKALEVHDGKGGWKRYSGDCHRVYMNSHPMSLEDVKDYMAPAVAEKAE